MHAQSAQVGIGERESRRYWGQQLVVRGQLHSPLGKLVMRVAHVAPIRARCFNSKRTSFHVALELEHVESVDLRSEVRKADAVLPVFARAGQRSDTLKRVARRGRCRLLFLLGVQHILTQPLPLTYLLTYRSLVKCVCVAFVAVAGRRYTYTVCTYPRSRGGGGGGLLLLGWIWDVGMRLLLLLSREGVKEHRVYRRVMTLRCSTFQDNCLGEAVSGREGFVNDPLSRNQSGFRQSRA